MTITPRTADEVSEAVRAHACVLPRGAGTKPALSHAPEGVTSLDLSGLSEMVEYDPAEYTFTALAGTPLAQVQAELSRNGQYLPFDPPLAGRGATLGGTVAAGLSGPGRLRYGGVRDFIMGVQWVDGSGALIRGGGRVVKNAAGFDFPKLFTGSMGRLGVMTEFTFKVFPAPVARITGLIDCRDLADAVERLCFISGQPWEVEALELLPGPETVQLLVRFMGDEPALSRRMETILSAVQRPGQVLAGDQAAARWAQLEDLDFAGAGQSLVRVPLTPMRIAALEKALTTGGVNAARHYSMAGNLAWIAGADLAALDTVLRSTGLQGMTLRGAGPLRPGAAGSASMEATVKSAMDPQKKFPTL